MFEMKQLPFELSALDPWISSATMEFHYGRHYRGYIDKLNELVKDTPYAEMPLEAVIKESYRKTSDRAIYNNAGQAWNHQFFWNSLSVEGATRPPVKIMKQIEAAYDSYDAFKAAFKAKALGQFGSGWCWAVQKDGRVDIVATSNADNPVSLDLGQPLLCLDVWEHAYYLDYQNRRADFIDAFLEHMIKW